MSEKLHHPKGHEHLPGPISIERREPVGQKIEHEKNLDNKVEHLQDRAREHAVSGEEISITEKEASPSPIGVQKELKSSAYKQTLRRIQSKLRGPDKVLSRIVHQPAVEKISNIGASTVARPSGILGGGFLALLGSSVLLYMARHYGFVYNFTTFFVLFIAGFLLGLALEGMVKLFRRKRNA